MTTAWIRSAAIIAATPLAANNQAHAAPMPVPPPVTITLMPETLMLKSSLVLVGHDVEAFGGDPPAATMALQFVVVAAGDERRQATIGLRQETKSDTATVRHRRRG